MMRFLTARQFFREAGSKEQEAGSKKREAGSREQEAGSGLSFQYPMSNNQVRAGFNGLPGLLTNKTHLKTTTRNPVPGTRNRTRRVLVIKKALRIRSALSIKLESSGYFLRRATLISEPRASNRSPIPVTPIVGIGGGGGGSPI